MSLWGDDDGGGAGDGNTDVTHAIYSKYRGVTWDKTKAKWKADIMVQGKRHSCGYYEDDEEAAKAYDR